MLCSNLIVNRNIYTFTHENSRLSM